MPIVNLWYETNMTSDTSPAPLVASASSSNSARPSYLSFRDSTVNTWQSATFNGAGSSSWIKLNFGEPKNVNKIRMWKNTGLALAYHPSYIYIEGSNDDLTFNVLHHTGSLNWTDVIELTFENDDAYQFIRVRITNTPNSTLTTIGRILFGYNGFEPIDKTLILNDGEYKKWDSKYKHDSLEMPENDLVLSTTSAVTRVNHIKFDSNFILQKIGYKTEGSNSLTLKIYEKDSQKLVFSMPVSITKGWNYISISDVELLKNKDYLIGFYGTNIYGYKTPTTIPISMVSSNHYINGTVFGRYDASGDSFPTTLNNTTALMMSFEGTAVSESGSNWMSVSTTTPTLQQFLEQGVDSLSPLFDRKITVLEPMAMSNKNEILLSEEGKVFSKTIDLKKYFDIRSIRTEVK
ncbi:discoidin domain-containing protein [Lysinibacillus agricola]|uniref:Discoidin domain-containing protein n=1 Tax=Lysinibacillus agricola TaxID=2590012 RepID=A0ABX7AN29_9BACI|nr:MULTISPECIES: discoidin domain-containing protein [Lysinibacillus]KOS61409.1 hypothetical protein AN161_17580 [Lysinibacillus sp. FJAT-14222]QQP10912.1 discoidin domain-containing protein [Lysinibacillus agricola]